MVVELPPVEIARRLREAPDGLLLVDVREPTERQFASIAPSVHIPMQQIPSRVAQLPRDREIVVFCHTGVRSAMVAAYLEHQGFPRVANLTGGIDAWSRSVDPRVPRYA
jgi:rhodanese-related sulfurtransferase